MTKFINLIWVLAYKNLKLKYKNSILGFFWSMINPLMYLIIFAFIFSNVFSDIERYPLYTLSGLVFWTFFSTSTIQVIESLIASSGVLKSINLPTIAFPLSSQLSAILSLGLTMIPFSILMVFFGLKFTWELLWFFPIFISFSLFTFGVSLILSSLNVYFRDVQLAWSSLLPAIFYSTPIAYSTSFIPAKFDWVLKLNPLYYYVTCLRDVLYYNQFPNPINFAICIGLGFACLAVGIFIFKKLEKGFVSQF